jgi:integrase/recombinase XerD
VKLSTAIAKYVEWKQLRGIRFVRGIQVLASLRRRIGDPELPKINPRLISDYLDGSKMAPDTWWRAYQMLRSFFQFWKSRGPIKRLPMPRPKSALPPPFRPYIYTKAELRSLLVEAGRKIPNGPRNYEPRTFSTIIVFLYGTGALIHEAIDFRVSDINFEERTISLRRMNGIRKRRLPISKTLSARLTEYLKSTEERRAGSDFVFLTVAGKQTRRMSLLHNFRRVCLRLGIRQNHGISLTPGMHDLRHTFAVHCLGAWLERGFDVRQMLPVLSAYMGHVMSRSTEQYLRLVPERFTKRIDKLVPVFGPSLMGIHEGRATAKSRGSGGNQFNCDPQKIGPYKGK